jgi:GNAT superfamily N-acetyltransferase
MITAQIESLTQGLEEIKPLFPLHYEELSLHQFHGIPLNPQYDEYLKRDACGSVLYATLRERGKLIGYFVGFIAPGLHYQDCLTLTMDIFYVLPEHRGSGGGIALFTEVKREAKRRGVKAWFMGNKEHAKIHATALFQAMRAEKAETYYCLWLGD